MLNAKPHVLEGNLLTYFGHNSFCFLAFQNSEQTCCGEGGGRQGGGGQGGGGQGGGGVSHTGAGIILSASCSLALFYFMFKVVCLLFQFMVQNLREVSVCT